MDKQTLKNVICNLVNDGEVVVDQIAVNFLAPRQNENGDFTVLGVKTGRGKGGSKIMELRRNGQEDSESLFLGTRDSAEILNVVVGGQLHGYESEQDVPPVYETDAVVGATLKETFRQFLGMEDGETRRVRISSSVSELDGEFDVLSARLMAGRYGQVVLRVRQGETEQQVWSFRHSGVISNFEVL